MFVLAAWQGPCPLYLALSGPQECGSSHVSDWHRHTSVVSSNSRSLCKSSFSLGKVNKVWQRCSLLLFFCTQQVDIFIAFQCGISKHPRVKAVFYLNHEKNLSVEHMGIPCIDWVKKKSYNSKCFPVEFQGIDFFPASEKRRLSQTQF